MPNDTPALMQGNGLFGSQGGWDDPVTQGLLAMGQSYFAGQGPTGFMAGYNNARQLNAKLQLEQQQIAAAQQQNDLNRQFAPVLQNPQAFSPDVLETVGMKLALAGHPGAATLTKIADARRAQERAAKDFAGMKSGEGYGGLFGNLLQSPYVGDEAKSEQAQLNKSEGANPDKWMQRYEKLRALHFQGLQADKKSDEAPVAVFDPKTGKGVFVSRKDAIGRQPASATELPALTGDAAKSAGAQIASGAPINQVIPGYGRNISQRREAARMEAIAQIMKETGKDAAEAGVELNNRQIDFAAGKKSVSQLTNMLGATKQAVSQLDFNVGKVTEAMDKLGTNDITPIVNAIRRGSQKWTGNPAYSELFFYMHAAAMESARILQGGQASVAQLHQGAAEEAKKWADAGWTTPQAWKQGVAPAMLAEGHARLKTYEDAIASQKLKASPQPASSPRPQVNPGWTPAKEQRYQELLRKRSGS